MPSATIRPKSVDGGFYFRNPNTRSGVFSNDDGETLLIGDMLDAQDGVLDGSAGCPMVSVTNNVPDPVALAQVFADPQLLQLPGDVPGWLHPELRR